MGAGDTRPLILNLLRFNFRILWYTVRVMDKWKHEAKQERIDGMIDKIVGFMLDNGYPPTQRKVAELCEVSLPTINAWIAEAKAQKKLDTAGSGKAAGIMVKGVYYVDGR